MALNDVNKNYTLGRGKLNFAQFRPGTVSPRGERYLGNSPELSYSASQDTLDHYSSDGGIRVKDASVILQQDYTGAFTLDDINMANMAMFFLGDASTVTTTARAVTGETFTDIEKGVSYQLGTSAADPSGVRQVSTVVVKKVGVTAALVAGTDYVLDPETARVTLLAGSTVLADGNSITIDYQVTGSTRDRVISKGKTIEGALRYIAQNPAGANIDFFMPYVKITPNGDFNLKGDDWQAVSYNIEILKKGDLEAVYADGRPYTAGDAVDPVDPVVTPLRVATAWNMLPSQLPAAPSASTNLAYIGYSIHRIAGGAKKSLGLKIPIWGLHDFSSGDVFPTPNNISFTGLSIEYNGVVAPLPVNGLRAIVGVAGTTVDVPDVTTQQLFGVASIPDDAQIAVKVAFTLPANNKFHVTQPRGAYDQVSKFYTYDPTVTQMSSVDTAGTPTWTGTAATLSTAGLDPIVVGRNASGVTDMTLIDKGDSISAGYIDDVIIPSLYGPGYIGRSAATLKMARLSLSVGGILAPATYNSAVINEMWKLGRFGIVSCGTNNFSNGSNTTAATLLGYNQAQRDVAKAQGIEKVVVSGMMCRSSSTDAWSTAANQTVNWDSQAQVTAYNNSLATAGFDGYCLFPSIRDATDGTKWKSNGSARGYVSDGIHPANLGHPACATDFLSVLRAAFGFPAPIDASALAVGESVQINPYNSAGAGGPSLLNGWNDLNVATNKTGQADLALVKSNGNVSNLTASILTGITVGNSQVTTEGECVVPKKVADTFVYLDRTGALGNGTSGSGTVTVNGLDDNATYTVEMFGYIKGESSRIANFSVNGETKSGETGSSGTPSVWTATFTGKKSTGGVLVPTFIVPTSTQLLFFNALKLTRTA